jgi:hypothetical protein
MMEKVIFIGGLDTTELSLPQLFLMFCRRLSREQMHCLIKIDKTDVHAGIPEVIDCNHSSRITTGRRSHGAVILVICLFPWRRVCN